MEIYQNLANPSTSCFVNFLKTIFQISFLSYFFFAFDIYTDFKLIKKFQGEYQHANVSDEEMNIFLNGLNTTNNAFDALRHYEKLRLTEERLTYFNLTESHVRLLQDPENYQIATYITYCLIAPSLIIGLIVSWIYFPLPDFIVEPCRKYVPTRGKPIVDAIMKFFKPLIFLGCHHWRRFQNLQDPNDRAIEKQFQECDNSWKAIKKVEVCFETVNQLVLSIWIFGPYAMLFQSSSWSDFLGHMYIGLGGFFGLLDVSFTQLLMGKFFFSTLLTVFGITKLKVEKGGSTSVRCLHWQPCLS